MREGPARPVAIAGLDLVKMRLVAKKQSRLADWLNAAKSARARSTAERGAALSTSRRSSAAVEPNRCCFLGAGPNRSLQLKLATEACVCNARLQRMVRRRAPGANGTRHGTC